MKKLFLLASSAALLALSACSSDDFFGGDQDKTTDGAIHFGFDVKGMNRADHVGADAATMLGSNFVVEGVSGDGIIANQVEQFDHYNVNYEAGSANKTESNTANWEYVGVGKHGLSAASEQTIKYWDYSAKQYDFIAFSYGKSNYEKAVLTEMKYGNLGNAVTDEAVYTVTGSAEELAKTYLADLVTLYNRDGVKEYGTTITPKFRSMGTKVRLAFYETVPGYSVKNVKFYSGEWNGTTATTASGETDATLFAKTAIFPGVDTEGTMSVYYPTVGWANSAHGTLSSDYNQAHVKFAAAAGGELVKTMSFSTLDYKAAKESAEKEEGNYLGRQSNEATYAGNAANNYYQTVLPLGTSDNLQIRVEYDLVPIDGGAGTIHVRDARAVVPKQYADWKPNYAYTYIFKISDNTNGWTGVDGGGNVVEGLTPITFDAVVAETEDGIQETITGVATPSITTYQPGVNVTATNEYLPGDIYVSVMNGTSEVTLTDSPANYGIYLVTEGDAIISEAIATDMLNGKKSNTGITWTPAFYSVVDQVPGADGNLFKKNAAKFAGVAGKTYVFNLVHNGTNYVKIIRVKTQVDAAAGYEYPVTTPYTYTADVTTEGNDVTFTYAPAVLAGDKHEILNDLARYLGALHYAGGAQTIAWNSTNYTWDPAKAGNLKGSNWYGGGQTLVKALTTWFASNPSATSITIQIDGVESTLSFQV